MEGHESESIRAGAPNPMRQLRPTTILVVEDEGAIREAVRRALADHGYTVMAARTGEEAVDLLWARGERIDWLFTDIRLPGKADGWRVAEEFRFAHPFRPVIYATASASDSERMVPGSLFVRKPYRPSEIVAAFRRLSEAPASPYETAVPGTVLFVANAAVATRDRPS